MTALSQFWKFLWLLKQNVTGGVMKRKLLVCKECGHEQRINIYDREESKRLNIRLGPPTAQHSSRSAKVREV
jgi:hypothetical protein